MSSDSPATQTYSAIASTNAIKTSIATSASPQTYTTFNGTVGGAKLAFEQVVTATTSSHTGSYVTATPLTVKGIDAFGKSLTGYLTLTMANGGETVNLKDANGNLMAMAQVIEIDVPAQNDTSGAFTFGYGDFLLSTGLDGVRAGSDGNVKVEYANGITDTVPMLGGEFLPLPKPRQVFSSGTTALPITLFRD